MNSVELKELLADVIAPISAIEKKTGIPKNVLQQSLKGKRNLPKEWVVRLKEFVEKKQYVGLRRKKPTLKFAKTTKKVREQPLETKLSFTEPTETCYDGGKADRIPTDEYGQMVNIGEISRDTWKHTDIKVIPSRPKNLEELKAMCPKELTGFEKAEWIRNKRVEYGI